MKSRMLKTLALAVCCLFAGFCFLSGAVYALSNSTFTLYVNGSAVDSLDNVRLETGDSYLFEIEGEGNYTDNYIYNWTVPSGSRSIKIDKVSGTDGRQVYVTPSAASDSGIVLQYDIYTLDNTFLGSNTVTVFISDVIFSSNLVKDAIAHGIYEVKISKAQYKVGLDAFKEIYELEQVFYFVNGGTDVSIAFDGMDLSDIPKEDYQKTVALGSSFTADRLIRKAVSQQGLNSGYAAFNINEQYKVLSLSDAVYPAEAVVNLNLGKDYADYAYNSELYVYRYNPQKQTLGFVQMAAVVGRSSSYIEISVSQGGCYIFTPYNLSGSASSLESSVSSLQQSSVPSSSQKAGSSSGSSLSSAGQTQTGSAVSSAGGGNVATSNGLEPIPLTADKNGVLMLAALLLTGSAAFLAGILFRHRKQSRKGTE